MKYLLALGLLITSFVGGIFFENQRLVGDPDKTIAIMLSKQAIDNSTYQIKLNSEYISHLENEKYKELETKINSNIELLSSISQEASSICKRVECNKKQREYILGAGLSDE